MAQAKSTSPDPAERMAARQLGKASIGVSVAGMVIGVIIMIIWITVGMNSTKSDYNDHY